MSDTNPSTESAGTAEPRLIVFRRWSFIVAIAGAILVAIPGYHLTTLPELLWQLAGWLVVALALAVATSNALPAWSPSRFAFIRLGETAMECRFGINRRAVDYLEVGKFHVVPYVGGSFLSWRRREDEAGMDPATLSLAPDPFERFGRGIKLPSRVFPPGESLARVCADLNRFREDAIARAGVTEAVAPLQRNLDRPKPFLAPPAIGRLVFVLLFFGIMPVYFVLGFLAYRPLRATAHDLLVSARVIAPDSLAPSLVAVAILLAGYFLLASWIVFGRMRDIDRDTRWQAALGHAFDMVFYSATAWREWGRLLGRRGRR